MENVIMVGMFIIGVCNIVFSFIVNTKGAMAGIIYKAFPFLFGAFLIFGALVLSGNIVFTTAGSLL